MEGGWSSRHVWVFRKREESGGTAWAEPQLLIFPVFIVKVSTEPSQLPQIPVTFLLYMGKCSDWVGMCWTVEFRFPVLIILSSTAFTEEVMPTHTPGQGVVKALAGMSEGLNVTLKLVCI